ncbi:hypothetical protein CDO22_34560 (plasmid) [Sinorhizobium meliloti]|nr:hypothetical protein CDO22_34560 [Sinorhizobium meliloti]
MVVSVLLWSRPLLTPRHHHCEGRPPSLQTWRAGFRPLHHHFSPEREHPGTPCALGSRRAAPRKRQADLPERLDLSRSLRASLGHQGNHLLKNSKELR